jgi:glucose-6-phosphate 1-dehydrogenase
VRHRVLLVLVGALGDLAWRKFIAAARIVEQESPNVAVLLVDMPWPAGNNISLDAELNLRIARRRIEVRAEEISGRKVEGLSLSSELGSTQFPWRVDDFVAGHLRGDSDALKRERKTLQEFVDEWVVYFTEPSPGTELMRYSSDPCQIRTELERLRQQGWKVAVLVATPSPAYAAVVNQWEGVADRIVLEKPAGCLDPQTMAYSGTKELRQAASRIQMPSQIVTNDHYNSKAIVRMMDRIRDYHLFDALLDPARIKRIVVQLLESAPLPMGRYGFYNGAGGAFGDMVPHLLQAVRAILGIPQGSLKIEFVKFYWAKCDCIPLTACRSMIAPYSHEPNYYQPLSPDTESFVAFKALVEVEGYLIPLYCRTGKGINRPGKTLRVDTRYSDSKADTVSLIFDIQEEKLTIRDDYKRFIMTTGKISLTDPFQSGVPPIDTEINFTEYKAIFNALVQSEWTGDALDSRYFPLVQNAADLSDMIFGELIKERNKARAIHTYSTDESSSYLEILEFLDDEARWG